MCAVFGAGIRAIAYEGDVRFRVLTRIAKPYKNVALFVFFSLVPIIPSLHGSIFYKIDSDYSQTIMILSKTSFCCFLTLLLCPFIHAASTPGLTFLFNVSIHLAKPLTSPTLVLPLGGIQLSTHLISTSHSY